MSTKTQPEPSASRDASSAPLPQEIAEQREENPMARAKRLGADFVDPSRLNSGQSVTITLRNRRIRRTAGAPVANETLKVAANPDGTFTLVACGKTACALAPVDPTQMYKDDNFVNIELMAKDAADATKIAQSLMKQTAFERAREVLPIGQLLPTPLTAAEKKRIHACTTVAESGGNLDASLKWRRRTEYAVNAEGENTPERLVETKTHTTRSGKHTLQTRSLVVTRELSLFGVDEAPRALLREKNIDHDPSGPMTVVKEQELSTANRTPAALFENWVESGEEHQLQPALDVATRVTVETSQTARVENRRYEAMRTTTSVTFELQRGAASVLNQETGAALLTSLRDAGRELERVVTESRIETTGTNGGTGFSVAGSGVELDAEFFKTTLV